MKKIFLSLLALTASSVVSAQTISLYDQPNQNAKVVGTADLSSGIVPIFTPPNDNTWMKVADPRNGNVGWIKSSDIKNAKGSESSVTFSQKVLSNGQPDSSFQVIQFGNGTAPKISNEQAQAILLKMRTEQKAIQENFQGILKNMNDVIQREWNMWNSQGGFPVIIVPAPGNASGKTLAPKPEQNTAPAIPPAPVAPTKK